METNDIKITQIEFLILNEEEDCFGFFQDERDKAFDLFIQLKAEGKISEDEDQHFHPDVWTDKKINLLFDSYDTIVIREDETLWAYNSNNEIYIGKAKAEGFYNEAKKLFKK